MSEQSAEIRRFDDSTPESAVMLYAKKIGKMEEFGLEYFDIAYRDAMLELNDIFNSVNTQAGLKFEAIKAKIMPLPIEESGLDPKLWINLLRMAPVLMLEQGVPEMDTVTPAYARSVMHASLSGNTGHDKECMSFYDVVTSHECLVSKLCPPQITYNIMTRIASDILIRRRVCADTEQGTMLAHTDLLLANIQDYFEQTGIANKEQFQAEVFKIRDRDWAFLAEGVSA